MNTHGKCDDIALALYWSGHLDENEVKSMEDHLSKCRYCSNDLEELKKSSETLMQQYPFEGITLFSEYIKIVEKIW
ncbi:MAG: hypothetical protein JW795_10110 [Chitinivibrionales bacterium]|nr:hypothetical protein [Chitinivibrionales bacterium]